MTSAGPVSVSVTVTDHAATQEQAVHGAAQNLARLLDSTMGRPHDYRETASGLPLSGTDPARADDRGHGEIHLAAARIHAANAGAEHGFIESTTVR
ncbi:MAG: hypothetical protein H7346_19685 [Burkholderiaceae bacterium]|nr:hypothetical protein [Burkholderiaceae bacterium]